MKTMNLLRAGLCECAQVVLEARALPRWWLKAGMSAGIASNIWGVRKLTPFGARICRAQKGVD
jgi:hypothetical protein